jgi:hypothetical protein
MDEFVYYSAFINPDVNGQANMIDIRVKPLLNKPSDYKMTITEFNITSFGIPIQIVPPVTGNINELDYQVAFYDSISEAYGSSPLIWITQDKVANVPTDASIPNLNRVNYFEYYSLYNPYGFIEIMNTALAAAWVNFCTYYVANVGPLPTGISMSYTPYVILNSNSTLSLIGVQAMNNPIIGIIDVNPYFSSTINNMLDFNATIVNTLDFLGYGSFNLIDFRNLYNNSITIPLNSPGAGEQGYVMSQVSNTLENLSQVATIMILTKNIPIRNQYFNSLNTNVSIGNIFKSVIAEKEYNSISSLNRDNVVFVQTGESKWIDLTSDIPLSLIDLNFVWVDFQQNVYPINLVEFAGAYVKIQFKRKTKEEKFESLLKGMEALTVNEPNQLVSKTSLGSGNNNKKPFRYDLIGNNKK